MNVRATVFIVLLLGLHFPSERVSSQVRALSIPDEAERNDSRVFISYNENQDKSEVIEQRWLESGAWGNHRRHVYTREDDGRTNIQTMQVWHDGRWNDATREIMTLDANNNITSRTREQWNNEDGWIPEQRDIMIYDERNRRNEWRSQVRTADGNWYYDWRFTFTYDDDNNLIEETYQIWNRNRWEIIRRITSEYTADNLRANKTVYEISGRVLTPVVQYQYEYDANGHMVRQTKYERIRNTWRARERETYAYDEKGRLKEIQYIYIQNNGGEVITARDLYTYNDEENTTERTREQRLNAGDLQDVWRYITRFDFRGFKAVTSYLEFENDVWIERVRTSYTYDIYGNQTSRVTQR